ncbi:MAG: hypothetical protein Q8N34_03190 [Gammaproteobacteria bacterium]|nr:hypothetical protein [Gammaproteobacteria bacterium]
MVDPTKVGTIRSIYRFAPTSGNDASGYWFHWTGVVDAVRGPVRGDTSERTYFTGDGVPKVTDNSIALSGGTDYPENSYTLGIPVPGVTIGIAVTGDADEGATEADTITRAYVITYVSAWGEEGPPSAVSPRVDLLPGQSVSLSALGTAPIGNYNITHKRIYRTATGAGTTQFYFVAEIAISTTTYSDTIEDAVVGEELPSETWYAPPTDMHSIGVLDNGIGFGASKNEVYVSEPYLLHAWNPLNAQPSNHPIVGCGKYGNTIVALTTANPLIVTGVDPSSMTSSELAINQGCVSKRSIVNAPFGVLYASPDGLVLVGPGSPGTIVTKNFLTRDQWQALNPHSIMGVLYNGMYMGFYDTGEEDGAGAFILDPENPASGFLYLDIVATAAYADPLSDSLYLCIDGKIVTWDTGNPLEYTWRSKRFVYGRPVNYVAARIMAEDYVDLKFKSYVNGVLTQTKTVINGNVFRLPYTVGREFEYELSGTSTVVMLEIAETGDELVQ